MWLLFPILLSLSQVQAQDSPRRNDGGMSMEGGTVVLCDPGDAYYPLALEICRGAAVPCVPQLDQALAANPRFLLWVGSPASFTDRLMVQAGMQMKSGSLASSVGIISGKTLEEARTLWRRGAHAGGARAYAVHGEYPPARVLRGRILSSERTATGNFALTRPELVEVLKNADYVTFTGHGSGSFWRLAEGVTLEAADLPSLPPQVLATAGFRALRLNSDPSIALAAVAQGAAAYAGFVFSPIEGYLIGEFEGLPLRYTWPGVTIGEVIRLQNRGAMQGFAALPCYFLLGDPRISLQPEASWNPLGIETVRGLRTCNYGETPPGFFPIRIRGGARYHYFEIPGVTAASDGDLFYNSRLQMLDAGPDKLILMSHQGGELKICMRAEAPLRWRLADPVLDALDYSLLYLPGTGGVLLPVFSVAVALLGTIYLLRQEKNPKPLLMRSSLVGLAIGLIQTLYVLNRIDRVTITSKPVTVGPADVVAAALLAGCGMILFLKPGPPAHKAAGVAVAVLPSLAAAVLSSSITFVFNTFYAGPALGAGIYNYAMTDLALIGAACQAAVFVVFALLLGGAWWPPRPKGS